MDDGTVAVVNYHQDSKHSTLRYAAGPRGLDWSSQPDPFRRFEGCRVVPLERDFNDADTPEYDSMLQGGVEVHDLDLTCVSKLLYYSMALSAWKSVSNSKWCLRVNPSSGNLHPTESYAICGPIEGLTSSPDTAAVLHYSPYLHALEVRSEFPVTLWRQLTRHLPPNSFLMGITSIYWREAWKYGVRAFRYSQHDVGHAIAAISMSAAMLGWRAVLLPDLSHEELSTLLGTRHGAGSGVEAEVADCILALMPSADCTLPRLEPSVIPSFEALQWAGKCNKLSSAPVVWEDIDIVAAACCSAAPPGLQQSGIGRAAESAPLQLLPNSRYTAGQVFRKRRSAVDYDAATYVTKDVFFRILLRTLPHPATPPWTAWTHAPRVSLLLFVHRVDGLTPGLYCFARNPKHATQLSVKKQYYPSHSWQRVPDTPEDLPLYLLTEGDTRAAAKTIACHQDIAADGAFSVGMVSKFEQPVVQDGAAVYPQLFWECGMIGQVLYLEAEAMGIQGTGIGCYFDDASASLLNISSIDYQVLYHFAVGKGILDSRILTLPAYHHLS